VDEADGYSGSSHGEQTELRQEIERLQTDLSRYTEQEQHLFRTLVSATSHAAAIRESARREAELMLRKASAEVERRKAAADRERRELLRLRRITEQTRRGLAGLLTAKLEELQLDVEDEPPLAQHEAELAAALESGLERNLEGVAFEPALATPELQPRDQHEQGSTGASADAYS
jgi:cell division septum initiation protein DivIVA